jgi:MFS family permease
MGAAIHPAATCPYFRRGAGGALMIEAEAADAQAQTQPVRESLFRRARRGITRNTLVLGVVSFFTDIASEMILPIRVIFLVAVLQTPLPIVGLIEGVAAGTTSLLSIVSGRIADRASRRKPLILFGYGLSNAAKPLLALVSGWGAALALIFLDRVGKGVRGSPRDALLADSTPPEHLGKAFGFHRTLDTLGAAIGPLITAAILLLSNNDLRPVFAWAAVPGLLAVLVVLFFLRESRVQSPESRVERIEADESRLGTLDSGLGTRFWMFTGISTLFALGNSSDAFLLLRAAELNASVLAVPLVYFGFNVVYALFATPLGALSDRWGRLPVLLSGYIAFGLVYAGWAVATQAWNAWALFLVYGVYAAATEGVGKAFVADLVPREARGRALGWYIGLTGFAALPASFIGGWLWSAFGPSATFAYGAWAAAITLGVTLAWLPWLRRGYGGFHQRGKV